MTESDTAADDWQLVRRAHYNRDGRHDLTTAIIFAVAAAEDVAPDELKEPVLYECVDVDAIEGSFFGRNVLERNPDDVGTVAFRFGEYRIDVTSTGWISIYTATPASVEK
ncbi:MAG TPA: HalOD1 output domain-containing protein [Methanomicrobiales archaeon]|nr:HalOD1 output domain-containing protein [Methanomicrobiales archaeon]